MVITHSSNSLILKAVASLNKAVKAHAYRAVLSSFNAKSKAQFITDIVSAKIKLPAWWGCLPKSKKQKLEAAQSFWNTKINSHAHSYVEANFSFVRPKKEFGYGALLKAANKLGEFSWAQLLLSIPHHAQKIAEAYKCWGKYSGFKKTVYSSKDGKSKQQYVSFDSYANNYFNSYRAYFVKNRIIAKVRGKRGIYTLTPNGKLLLSGMKQLDTMR